MNKLGIRRNQIAGKVGQPHYPDHHAYGRDWLSVPERHPRPEGRLFCIPYAGGGISVFRPWLGRLPSSVELCCIQLPGRERRFREPPIRRLEPLVDAIAEAIIPVLDLPFAFFGHSLGALVSFALARNLRSVGAPLPDLLLPSGAGAPHLPQRHSPAYDLPLAEMVEYLERYAGTPAPQLENQELLELTLPALRADLEVTDTYVYEKQSPLQCPITAFAGADDPLVSQDELAGWRHHTSGDFRSHRMAGNHLYVTLPDDRFFGILSGELERHLR